MKGSSSRMKNKMGAQKGAFIKMKQENNYIYQRICMFCSYYRTIYLYLVDLINIKFIQSEI